MSDSALSQAEIDALLSGGDAPGGAAAAVAPRGSEEDRATLQNFLSATVNALSSTLAGSIDNATLKGPEVSFTNQDVLQEQLPDMVTVVKADFSSGFPGEHMFILPEDAAKAIAGFMLKTEEAEVKMDDMTLSVIGEAGSQLVGSLITGLTNKTGNKSIASISPEAVNMPRATAPLPGTDFPVACYQLDLGDGKTRQLWEVFGSSVGAGIARALKGGSAPAAPSRGGAAMGSMNSMMGGMQGMGSTPGGGMGAGNVQNVQSVQFPNLMPHPTAQEHGNIGLIMDVYMEMTVELGRTKKLIKEILGMGEGTIIELDKLAGEPVDILVNHKLIAKGEVVVIDENFGVRVTEIVSPMERAHEMN
ncbi:MAG: flagellar motor switch protein FliN [Treponema sp.]|jgi:flagellar motor switch protein FliN/FliY|nr:flagellar motor switch protein FliN [Treponema sp.]